VHPLSSRIVRKDRRALARALSFIENDSAEKRALLRSLYAYAGRAHIIGFTGPPGAGKSTLVDQMITFLRAQNLQIGVLAVDPSSPFTGGALLGDRVRMTQHSADPGVYIRSMGSRGSLGGLGKSSREMLYALEAYGCDVVLLETVGVGQSELDVLTVADTVVLMLTPGAGDHVQTAKAGIMEIADVFVVNKDDLPGSDALVREVQLMLHDKKTLREGWNPPVLRARATAGIGIEGIWAQLVKHYEHLKQSGYWQLRRQARHREEALQIIESRFRADVRACATERADWQQILSGEQWNDPYASADEILRNWNWCPHPLSNDTQVD